VLALLHCALALRDDVPGVNHTRNPSEDPQEDVDPEICSEAAFEQDWDRWNEYGDEVEEDVGSRRYLGPAGRDRRLSSGAMVYRGGRV